MRITTLVSRGFYFLFLIYFMKKILIIGAQGMLGQELVKVFKADSDYKVIGWDRGDIDITREKEVDKKIGVIKPEIIINAAAMNDVDACESEAGFETAKKVNGYAPGYLAAAAKKNKATLVHYSSDYVFDGDFEKILAREPQGCTHVCATCHLHDAQELGFCEDDDPQPVNKYGETKLLGEKEVAKNLKKHYIIRTSKIFGVPGTGEGSKKSFFDTMLELGEKNKEIKVVDEETACFTYAPDLAKKTKEIVDSQKPFGTYHVTNSGAVTWFDACTELYDMAKIKTKIVPVSGDEFPRPAARPFYSVLVNTKLNPLRSYQEALKEYLKIKY